MDKPFPPPPLPLLPRQIANLANSQLSSMMKGGDDDPNKHKSNPKARNFKWEKKTGRKLQFDAKEPVSFDKTKVECYNCHKTWHFAREYRSKGNQDSRRRDAWNIGIKAKDIEWIFTQKMSNENMLDGLLHFRAQTLSFSHLIRDCNFHEKRMAKQAELNKRMCKGTDQRENRPVWNNVQIVDHQNQFVPTAVLTRTGRIQVNTARASSPVWGCDIINHHKAWFRAVRLKKQQNKKDMEKSKNKRSVSKLGRKAVKSSKGAPSVQTHTDWDGLDTGLEATLNEAMDYTLAQDEGKTDSKVEEPKTSSKTEELHLSGDTLVAEDKGSAEKEESTKSTNLQQSTVKPDESTIKPDEDSRESATPTAPTTTSTPTLIVFGDDKTIAQVLVIMSQNKVKQKEKEKRIELKNVEDIERPRPTSTRSVLTLKPLPKIDPKAKGKGMIEEENESDTESEDITEVEKKFKMLANDEEMARKVQEEEREKFTIEERAKLLHDTIAAQRRFLDQQRSEVIRNKLPSRTQLRNQMMTYLKHVEGKKHSDLKTKFFEEIHVLYEKVKRSDENFIAIGSVEDERLIKDLNKKFAGIKKADSIKEESKEEEGTKKRKLGTRKKIKSRKRRFRQVTSKDDETNSEKENDELRLCLTIVPDEDKEVDYEILDKNYPITEWKSKYLGIKPQYDETKDLKEINLNVVIRSNGQRRYFSTLMRVFSIFDRDDLCDVYQLMMDKYQDEIPEDFAKVLWGDLMIMFNPSDEDEFWNSQQDWNVVSWKLYGSSRVHTLMTEARLVIHMLVEKKYPLRKKVLLKMLELKLESEEDSTMELELIRFVKKLIAELEPENSDGDEEDL
ncbi:hypothetical protein Tco_0965826 [Tanacetum coccineum]